MTYEITPIEESELGHDGVPQEKVAELNTVMSEEFQEQVAVIGLSPGVEHLVALLWTNDKADDRIRWG